MNKKDLRKEIIDFLKDLIIIGIIVLIIRTFIAAPYQISGHSMDSSYYNKEFIIVDRFSYLTIPFIKKGFPNRGDVVVLKPGVDKERKYFLKRIIGLPGETLKIKDGYVYIKKESENEFVKLNEEYLNQENNGHTKVGNLTKEYIFKIPEGKYFVMGDNRNHSTDSRVCFSFSCDVSDRDAYILKKDIIGKVLIDLGYFNFKELSFINTEGDIDTKPRFLNNPSSFDYE